MRMKFRVWHLLVLTLVAAASVRAMTKMNSFPIATKTDAAKANAIGHDFVEMIGDNVGPYRWITAYVEAVPHNDNDNSASVGSSQWVPYQLDGKTKMYQIPTQDDSQARINIYENPRGNHLLVILKIRHP